MSVLLTKTWDAVASDIALHGLAYLGVVLTFVGVLGFLLFAFVDVADTAQPFVELFIVFIFFGWAWMLRRQKAERVADGMELMGGMVVPLILFAGLVDNAPFPPDFSGGALIVALTVSSVAMAWLYAWISRRNEETTLRFLVGPLLWLGAMAVGFVFKTDELLFSDAITRLVSPQPSLAALAIALTLILCLTRREHRLAGRTVVSALVGVPVAYLLAISLSVGEGWALAWPLVLLGASTLVSIETLAVWFDKKTWMAFARPVLLAGAVVPLVPSLGVGWAGLVVAISYLGLYEYEQRRDATLSPSKWLVLAGVGVGLLMSLEEPAAGLISFAIASVWAHLRRVGGRNDETNELFTAAAALLPIGVLFGLGELLGIGAAWFAMAIVIAVLHSRRANDGTSRYLLGVLVGRRKPPGWSWGGGDLVRRWRRRLQGDRDDRDRGRVARIGAAMADRSNLDERRCGAICARVDSRGL